MACSKYIETNFAKLTFMPENYYITQDYKSDTEPRLKLITLDRTMVSDDSGIL